MATKKNPNRVGSNDITGRKQGWNKVTTKAFPEQNPRERVSMDIPRLDRFINQQGVFVNVYLTTYCPNVKSIDGAEHEVDCDMCNGSGFLDKRPIKVRAVIQSQNLDTRHAAEGLADGNTVSITFPRGVEMQYFNLIELCDFNEIYLQRVARSSGSKDVLKYAARRVNLLADQNGIEYFEGKDFKLDDSGNIIWKTGKGPSPETIYSIHYEARIQFRAIRAMHSNRFLQVKAEGSNEVLHVKAPEQWLCTKEFLVRRLDKSGEDLLPNAIPGYTEETPEE